MTGALPDLRFIGVQLAVGEVRVGRLLVDTRLLQQAVSLGAADKARHAVSSWWCGVALVNTPAAQARFDANLAESHDGNSYQAVTHSISTSCQLLSQTKKNIKSKPPQYLTKPAVYRYRTIPSLLSAPSN